MSPRKFATNRKVYLALLAIVIASMLVGCAGSWHVQDAVGIDVIFSVETRLNNISIVWLKNDESGAYCVEKHVADKETLMAFMRSRQEVEFVYSDIGLTWLAGNPCYQAESSIEGAGFHTFYVSSIKLAQQ